ncbi:heme-binding protein [Rhodoferax sp.]|uniref:SOUL family heme-binding protein n=1 Tax=Rhodoferax sp. TaxID=50421 RepID=UPI0025EA89FA|nr:heme-binding protein [Rhodoferax sp.]
MGILVNHKIQKTTIEYFMVNSLNTVSNARRCVARMLAIPAVFLAAMLTVVSAQAQLFSLEQPKFQLLDKEADFELRRYSPMIVAEVTVQGDLTKAGKEGSRLVKQYIFREGANASLDQEKQAPDKISMTVPVTLEKVPEKISMTLPVTMEAQSPSTYRLHFVMPSSYTLDTLPKSADPRVTTRAIPEQKFASVRFSKFSTEANVAEQTVMLRSWMDKKGLVPNGLPQFARYDPPSVPPLLRRSEILIPVQ